MICARTQVSAPVLKCSNISLKLEQRLEPKCFRTEIRTKMFVQSRFDLQPIG